MGTNPNQVPHDHVRRPSDPHPRDRPRAGHPRNPCIAAPIGELVEDLGLPLSSYYAEEAAGNGCRCFKIGRRKFALLSDWQTWLEARAAATPVADCTQGGGVA
jgi:hypothetical protein